MDRLIYTAMTGASGILSRQAAVAHNLANVTTPGYRAEEHRLRAVQVLTHNQPPALPTRAFAVDASTHADFSAGALHYTGNPTDVAVKGRAGSRWPCPTVARPIRATAASRFPRMACCRRRTAFRCRAMAVRSPSRPIRA
jgi:hypothetical protein